jgi:hypothetical protein
MECTTLWQGTPLPGLLDKKGRRPRSIVLPAVAMMRVMTVSPVVMSVSQGASHYHGWGAVHHGRRSHDHGRACDDHRRRIHDRWRGSDDDWGGVHRDANANGDPDARMRRQHQSGTHQAC